MSEHGEISAYDRMVWSEGQVEQWLATGQHRRELHAYFGEEEYARLVHQAIAAAGVRPDPDRVVLYVPGLMGTRLALPRERPAPDNLLWLDPTDIHHGRLTQLILPGPALIPCGLVPYAWLPLKLALATAGYTLRCFAYDWRLDLNDSAALLAQELASIEAREISLVGHSMGGLLARAVLRGEAGQRVRRLITLGTPHGGSFAPVQAVRGVYPLVRRLAQLDPLHSPELLSREVFSSFHSLYQMLPRELTPDLLESRNWPQNGPQPNATLLSRAVLFDPGGADPRIDAIAGHGYLTTLNVASVGGEFWYRYGYAGDGTVPMARATLSGCRAWYCQAAHNELPRDPAVQAALLDLLEGRTPQLSSTPPAQHDDPVSASDSQLRGQLGGKLDWPHLDSAQRRSFLDSLNAPPPAASGAVP